MENNVVLPDEIERLRIPVFPEWTPSFGITAILAILYWFRYPHRIEPHINALPS
jgi:hypothetical protein